MSALSQLQDWYLANCDDDWEHTYGVKVETLDNPGWMLSVDLVGTPLEASPFAGYEYGLELDDDEWVHCKVDGKVFKAAGGPRKLEEMIEVFLAWASGDLSNE